MRSLIAWLSKRFPEKLSVTRQDYTELRQEVGQLNALYQTVNAMVDKVNSFDKRLKNLENANGFVSNQTGSFKLER